MKNLFRSGKPGIGLLAFAGAFTLIGAPYYVSAQKGRPVPGRIQTLTPYFLLKGEVTAIDGSLAVIKTPNYGPGLSQAGGVHSHAIVLGKTYLTDLSNARFEAMDGTPVTSQKLAVGDKVVMLVNATPGAQVPVGNTTMFKFTAQQVIRNDQTPSE